jgi:hypothetical protein
VGIFAFFWGGGGCTARILSGRRLTLSIKFFITYKKKCNAQKSTGLLIMTFFVELCIENVKFHLK